MELLELPQELFYMILKNLDFESLNNVYNTCSVLRCVALTRGLLKTCDLSVNTMASVQTFKLDFFKNVAENIQELNMSAVSDLYKSSLTPVIKKMKKLSALDVSFTRITLLDLIDIYDARPTLKNIAVNFVFGKIQDEFTLNRPHLEACQELFKNFDRITFVGTITNLFFSNLPQRVLQAAVLKSLRFIITECELPVHYEGNTNCDNVQFDQFYIFFVNWKRFDVHFGNIVSIPILTKLDWKKHDFIIIIANKPYECTVYVSPIFKEYIKETFNVDATVISDMSSRASGLPVTGDCAILIWNNSKIEFDINFFNNLTNQLKTLLAFEYVSKNDTLNSKNNWFYIRPTTDVVEQKLEGLGALFKKRRSGVANMVLNYDKAFNDKDNNLHLHFIFTTLIKNSITLESNSDYLKKVTYLGLTGPLMYSRDFFNIVLSNCTNLITLNVEGSSVSPCTIPISQAITHSKRVKNLRLMDKIINFDLLFSSLGQCSTLENVHIFDTSSQSNDIGNPVILIEKCKRLYSLFIISSMSDTLKTKKIQLMNKAKANLGKPHLNIELYTSMFNSGYSYDPFIDVFKLSIIKPI